MRLESTVLDFKLPPELEAREPAELRGSGRDDVRLMVSHRQTGDVAHAHFRELPAFLRAGDLLVLNTTATLPAALRARRENGEEIALHYSTSLPGDLAVVEPRQAHVDAGERLILPGGARARLLIPYRDSSRLWIAQLALPQPLIDYLRRYGRPITYSYIKEPFPLDAYQTVYARDEGSAEMPSAGRAFTRSMLACLRRSGVALAKIVLHAGVASLENHESPYEEWYEVPLRTAERVRETKERGGRVIAVGTTVVRALESSVDRSGNVIASRGWTDVVITPERGVKVVDGLLTGFHEPRASHLKMLEAIAGREHIQHAYGEALQHGYLWHEFGDLHLIV
ncbi:MAG TPA: S-adenosylmethionine:tRNA ribosyltransferase-isomerase [Thermoanaerobaculia bacterium]|nr:S-adenosylmethionine:tRNA ribosyltransferase-isomerase [Thermoanaerobaculia bacterium]